MAKLKAVSRRGFVSLAGKTLLGASAALSMERLSFGEGASPGNERPNIIVFLTDDLGWGDLSCYGHPIIKSPNLDRLAQQGMRLSACYSASSVCSPSRSAILTGRTPYRNGVFTWIPAGSPIHLRPTEITASSEYCRATLNRLSGTANRSLSVAKTPNTMRNRTNTADSLDFRMVFIAS